MAKKEKEKKDKGGNVAVAEAPSRESAEPAPVPRLLQKYNDEIRAALKKQFQFGNELSIPKLEKIVLNMGVGKAIENKTRIDHAVREMTAITGQKPVITKAKKSVAGFKLREGMPIGVMVTLRGNRMYEFFDRLVSIAIPRIRDFRGFPRKADGRGNYNLGITEQSVFSEVNLDKMEFVQGLQVTIVTSTDKDEEALALMDQFGFPFRK